MHTPSRFFLSFAVLVLFALGAGCGSGASDSATGTPEASETSSPDVLSAEYGATIDEWAEAEGNHQDGPEVIGALESSDGSGTDPAYTSLEWEDLIPEGKSSDEVWAQYDDVFDELEYGSPEEELLYQKVQSELDPEAVDPALDGQQIRMNGFVAPLTYDEDIVTEFLLVPFFGACIHVPAPPANQTVLVSVDKENGLTLDESYGAIWIEGTLTIESTPTDLGATSYALTGDNSGVYEQA